MARRLSPIRSRKSFRRLQGQRAPRTVTLIVCEGETECAYFKALRAHLKLTTAEVIVADDVPGSAPITVVDHAEKRHRQDGNVYDRIFCVFDRDTHTTFKTARDKANQLRTRARNPIPMEGIASIPCFEFFVLLHFERTDSPFNECETVVKRIRDEHLGIYKKADQKVLASLIDKLETARANAVWVQGRAENNESNPLTEVHRVVEHLSASAKCP